MTSLSPENSCSRAAQSSYKKSEKNLKTNVLSKVMILSVFRAIPEYRHMLKGGHPCSYYEDKIAPKSGVEITTKRTTKKPFPRKQWRKQEEKIEITNCFSQTLKLFCLNNTSQKVSHTLRNTFKTCPIKFLHPGYAKNACSSTRWPTYKRGKEFKHISLVVPFA